MRHDCINLVGLSIGGRLLSAVNIHGIVALDFLLFALLLVVTAAAFAFKILAAVVGDIASACSSLGSNVHSIGIGRSGTFGNFLLFLLFGFVCTVFLLIGNEIGLWLVGRELRGSGSIGVPEEKISMVAKIAKAGVQRTT